MFQPNSIYGLDIETDTSNGYGLDPRRGGITEIAFVGADDTITRVFEGAEATMLYDLDAHLSCVEPGLIGTWNGTFFDLPFLMDRAKKYPDLFGLRGERFGLALTPQPGLHPKYDPLPGHRTGYSAVWERRESRTPHCHLDIMYAYRQASVEKRVSWSLKPIAEAHGLHPIVLDRERMHEYTPEERRAYVLSDGVMTRELALMVLGITPVIGLRAAA